jgi:hypothetical protein
VSLSVQQQPFAVTGTANEPFLAKIVFGWVGGSKMEVEHWVDVSTDLWVTIHAHLAILTQWEP